MEIWRIVPGYDDFEVSNVGRVRSLDRTIRRVQRLRSGKVGTVEQFLRGKILKPGIASNGYPTVALEGKTHTVHSLVMLAFVGPRPPGKEVRHLDGNRKNAVLTNLCYGTPHENHLDIARHGRRKLAPGQVADIRRYLALGHTLADIGKRFGVAYQQIGYIRDGRQYSHV